MRKHPSLVFLSLMAAALSLGQTKLPMTTPDRPMQVSPGLDQLSDLLSGATLSLHDAVKIALRTNRDLAQSEANLLTAQGKTAEAASALNPTLGSVLEGIRLNEAVRNKTLTNLDPQNFNSPIGSLVTNSNLQQQLVGVTAAVPIDISGTLHVAKDEARLQQQSYAYEVDAIRNQLVASVKAAFYQALRSQALVQVAEEDVQNSQDRLKDAQDRLAARVVTKIDVLRASSDVASAQLQLISARNAAKADIASLNLAIGIKVTAAIQLTDANALTPPGPLPDGGMSQQGDLGPIFKEDLAEALKNRPEIRAASVYSDAAKKGITLARRSQLPSLNLSWSYLYAPNAGGSTPLRNTWQAQAMLTLPIFDGGLARARVEEARGAYSSAETAERQAVDQVTIEAEQAYLSVEEARLRVDVSSKAATEAKAAFDLAKVRYKAGVSSRAGISPILELSDAQSALTLAETNQVNALYDYNASLARLDRALGRY